jgi:hypothetical protein
MAQIPTPSDDDDDPCILDCSQKDLDDYAKNGRWKTAAEMKAAAGAGKIATDAKMEADAKKEQEKDEKAAKKKARLLMRRLRQRLWWRPVGQTPGPLVVAQWLADPGAFGAARERRLRQRLRRMRR